MKKKKLSFECVTLAPLVGSQKNAFANPPPGGTINIFKKKKTRNGAVQIFNLYNFILKKNMYSFIF